MGFIGRDDLWPCVVADRRQFNFSPQRIGVSSTFRRPARRRLSLVRTGVGVSAIAETRPAEIGPGGLAGRGLGRCRFTGELPRSVHQRPRRGEAASPVPDGSPERRQSRRRIDQARPGRAAVRGGFRARSGPIRPDRFAGRRSATRNAQVHAWGHANPPENSKSEGWVTSREAVPAEVGAANVERPVIPTARAAPCRRSIRIARIGPVHPCPMLVVPARS